ncbi:hypothetical protein J4Q44_G00267890 [Coregonus suidteri]|uniref:Uncharacterized protein n=1 Tax=Coregonus suidteri TaxID=861788 RepID=A0AAN8QEG8_9TELE
MTFPRDNFILKMSDYIVKIEGTGPEESVATPEKSRDPSPEPAVLPVTDMSFLGAMEDTNEMPSSLEQAMDTQTQENGEQVEATESQRKRLKGNLGLSSAGCSLGFMPSFDSVSLTSTVNTGNNSGESLEQLQYQGVLRMDTCDEVEVKVPVDNDTLTTTVVDCDSSTTLDQMASLRTFKEEKDRVLDMDTVDCLSRTISFESSPIPDRIGSAETYSSGVRSATPYASKPSLTSIDAHWAENEVEVKVLDIDFASFTLDRISFSSTVQEEDDRVTDMDKVDCRSLSRTVRFETSPIPERSGSVKTYCSSVRSPTPYQSRLSLTSTEAHDHVAHSSDSTQASLRILMDPLEELFGISQDMIYTDVQDRVIEMLQDIYSAANQLEQQLFQSVSDRQARAIVKAVVQQINAALSQALQQTCSGSQLLTIVGSAKLYSKDGSAGVEGQGVPLITPSAEGDMDSIEEGSRPLKRSFNSFVRVLSAKMRRISKGIKQSSKSAQQEHRLVVELPVSSDKGTEQEETGSSTVSVPSREEITEVSEVLQSESDDSLLPTIGAMLFHVGSMPHTEDSVELYSRVPSKLTPESMVQEERVDEGLSKACSRTTSSTSTTLSMDDIQKTVATMTTSGSDMGRSIITTPEMPEQSLHHQGSGLDSPVSSERRVAESGKNSPATWSDTEGLSSAKKAVSELMERMVLSREDAASAEKSLDILLSSGILRPHTDKLVDQLHSLLMVNSTLTAQSLSGRSKSESALPKSRMTGELQREISRKGLLEIAYTITERSIKTLLEQLLTALLPPSAVVEVARSCQNIRPVTPSQVMSSEVSPGCCNPLSMICRVIIDVFTITRQVVETASEVDMSPPGKYIDGRLCSNTAPLPTDSTPPVPPTNRETDRSLATKPTNKVKSLTFSFPKLPKISLKKSKKVNKVDIAPFETTKDPVDVDYNIFCTTPTPENAPRQEEDLASCSSQRKERPKNQFFLIKLPKIYLNKKGETTEDPADAPPTIQSESTEDPADALLTIQMFYTTTRGRTCVLLPNEAGEAHETSFHFLQ